MHCFKFYNIQGIKSYFFGFSLSCLLTVLPFFIVMQKIFSHDVNHYIVVLFAIIQITVHFIYFLHLNFSDEQRWNVITLLFVTIIIFIVVFGTIWIMSNLNHYHR